MVKDSIDIAEKMGVLGAGYHPEERPTTCNANSKGLFAYYRAGGNGLRAHLPHARRHRLGLGGHSGRQGHSHASTRRR